jgi:hypothetical protein
MYCMHIKEKVGTPESNFFWKLCRVPNNMHSANKENTPVHLPCVFFSTRRLADTRQTKRPQPFQTVPECLLCAQHLAHGKEESFAVCFALPCFFFTSPRSMKVFYRASNLYHMSFTGHTANDLFAVCYIFSVCCSSGTRQRPSLPCARDTAHDKS